MYLIYKNYLVFFGDLQLLDCNTENGIAKLSKTASMFLKKSKYFLKYFLLKRGIIVY